MEERRTNSPPWKAEKNGFHSPCASIGPPDRAIIKENEDQFIYHRKPIKMGFTPIVLPSVCFIV
jgi:hypothetical protein